MLRQGRCRGRGNRKDPLFLSSQDLPLVSNETPRRAPCLFSVEVWGNDLGTNCKLEVKTAPDSKVDVSSRRPASGQAVPSTRSALRSPLNARGVCLPSLTPRPSALRSTAGFLPHPVPIALLGSITQGTCSCNLQIIVSIPPTPPPPSPTPPGAWHCSGVWRHHREPADKRKDNKHVNK